LNSIEKWEIKKRKIEILFSNQMEEKEERRVEFFDSFVLFFPFLFLNSTKVRCRCGRAGTVILAVALLLAESHLPLLMELLLPPSLARQCRQFRRRRGGGTEIDVTSDEIPRERRARRALFRRFAVGALPGRHRASRQFLRTRFAATPGMTQRNQRERERENKRR
jgi:hypothetical protein